MLYYRYMLQTIPLLCFGEIIWDTYPNKKVLAGAPLNVASVAAILGVKTGIVSAVNTRDYTAVYQKIKRRRVRPFLQKNRYPTGRARITLDAAGKPRFQLDVHSAFDHIAPAKLPKADYLYFGTLSQRRPPAHKTLATLLKNSAAHTFYDVNLRPGITNWRAIVQRSLTAADIVKMNEEELQRIKRAFHLRSVPQLMKRFTIQTVFVTKGARGAAAYHRGRKKIEAKPPRVRVVDTTGSGDAFCAAAIYGVHRGWPLKKTLRLAVNVSARNATYEGAFAARALAQQRPLTILT